MVARFRHAIRMGMGLVAVSVLSACAREATRPETTRPEAARPRAGPPAMGSEPAPDVPIRAELAHTVYFGYKSASLDPRARRAIDKWIAFLRVHDSLLLSLTGHTDSSGSRDENVALGEQRAAAVRRALIRGGIADRRISVRSRGEDEPQVYGKGEFAASRNRRVEFEITESVRGRAAPGALGGSARDGRAPAFLGTTPAGFSAALAIVVLVPRAFLAAGLAHVGAGLA